MLTLHIGHHQDIEIQPRFPARCVRLDAIIFNRLQAIQKALPQEIRIILTRGYENPNSALGFTRRVLRFTGSILFSLIYPYRFKEIPEIFTSNGHDKDGTHVDISLTVNSIRTNWLPYGVFTSPKIVTKVEKENETLISLIENKIMAMGGSLHRNRLERLQMHIDFRL
jgi:hypothetical protein